jgi:subtilisin family serine protease
MARRLLVIGIIALLIASAIIYAKKNSETSLSEIIDNNSKVHPSLLDQKLTDKSKIIVQFKNLTNSEKGKKSRDNKLLYTESDGTEIFDLVNDEDVVKIWPDLQTQSFLDESVYQINADILWNLGLNGSGVKIAILDTGIDDDHEMLAGRVVAQADFTTDGNYDDSFGHGTHVAGIAAGNGQYAGVAPGALIYNAKVLSNSGSGQLSWLIDGIDWAISQDVDIISMSLGAVYSGTPEEQLDSPEVLKVQEAIDAGITVVIASGNCASGACGAFTGVTSPGIAENAITVGAVDGNNQWASFSSGSVISGYIKPDVVAPGVGICSSVPSGYDCKSGTSMATPHIAGAAALILQNNTLSPSQTKTILESNAIDLGDTGKDIQYGFGLVNMDGILDLIETPDEYYQYYLPLSYPGKESLIGLRIMNPEKKPMKADVEISVEELDQQYSISKKITIPGEKDKIISLEWTPLVPGKHQVIFQINDQQIIKGINVANTMQTSSLGLVNLYLR